MGGRAGNRHRAGGRRPILATMQIPNARTPTESGSGADFADVAARLVPGTTIELVPDRPDLAVAVGAGERWKLRRWPAGLPRVRLDTIHQTIAAVHAAAPTLAPAVATTADGATSIVSAGRLFDAQSWLPGEPVAPNPEFRLSDGRWIPVPAVLDDPGLTRVCQAVAIAHQATVPLAASSTQAPLAELLAAVDEAWKLQRGVLRPLATATPAVRRWLAIGERALPAAETAIAAASPDPATNVMCHLGLWPAHVIAPAGQQDAPGVGLIGWEHCGVGSALIDLAQVISRFRGWTAGSAELALAAYSEFRALRPEERRLLPAVATLDLVAASGHMLIAAYGGRPGGTRPPTGLREGARQLLDSLDVATTTLTTVNEPKKPAREWRRDGPPRRRDAEPRRRPRGPKKPR